MNNSMLMIIAGLGLLWLLSKPKTEKPAPIDQAAVAPDTMMDLGGNWGMIDG